jgi:hypothetical protein
VGSNPRPADYEKYGPALRVPYLHGYYGIVPLMALIALSAPIARSTNRYTAKRRLSPILLLCVTSPGVLALLRQLYIVVVLAKRQRRRASANGCLGRSRPASAWALIGCLCLQSGR